MLAASLLGVREDDMQTSRFPNYVTKFAHFQIDDAFCGWKGNQKIIHEMQISLTVAAPIKGVFNLEIEFESPRWLASEFLASN
jgi:hypothetical protein